jgi:hypothetical protein
VAAVLAAERDRNALVLVLAADHVIRSPAFRDACRSAASAAAEGRIVTFGIEPTGPITSYGYVRPGEKLKGASVRAVEPSSRSQMPRPPQLMSPSLPLEQRQFPVSRRHHASEIERFATMAEAKLGRWPNARSRFHTACS